MFKKIPKNLTKFSKFNKVRMKKYVKDDHAVNSEACLTSDLAASIKPPASEILPPIKKTWRRGRKPKLLKPINKVNTSKNSKPLTEPIIQKSPKLQQLLSQKEKVVKTVRVATQKTPNKLRLSKKYKKQKIGKSRENACYLKKKYKTKISKTNKQEKLEKNKSSSKINIDGKKIEKIKLFEGQLPINITININDFSKDDTAELPVKKKETRGRKKKEVKEQKQHNPPTEKINTIQNSVPEEENIIEKPESMVLTEVSRRKSDNSRVSRVTRQAEKLSRMSSTSDHRDTIKEKQIVEEIKYAKKVQKEEKRFSFKLKQVALLFT